MFWTMTASDNMNAKNSTDVKNGGLSLVQQQYIQGKPGITSMVCVASGGTAARKTQHVLCTQSVVMPALFFFVPCEVVSLTFRSAHVAQWLTHSGAMCS